MNDKRPDQSRRRAARLLGSLPLTMAVGRSIAQSYPSKPIRMIVGFPPGSATDTTGRILAEVLRNQLGQPVIVENRPGANGSLSGAEVARASPDGYTILMANASGITINPQIYRKSPYQPMRDFAPVTMVVSGHHLLVINSTRERTLKVKSMADLIALAKANPDRLTYGSGGVGNIQHLAFEVVKNKTGVQIAHVPYKGGIAAQAGLLADETDTMLDTPLALPHIRSGRLRALAVASPQRWPELPDVPTMAEAGYPVIELAFWLGVLVPAQTPKPIIDTLYSSLLTARDSPIAMRQLKIQGNVDLTPPSQFGAKIKAEMEEWGEVIRREKIELE